MMEPSVTNGVSSATNGHAPSLITHQTHFQDQSHLQSSNVDKTQSISAGLCQNTRFKALDSNSLIFRLVDEIALYDRQIRLWGVKAQERYGKLGFLITD